MGVRAYGRRLAFVSLAILFICLILSTRFQENEPQEQPTGAGQLERLAAPLDPFTLQDSKSSDTGFEYGGKPEESDNSTSLGIEGRAPPAPPPPPKFQFPSNNQYCLAYAKGLKLRGFLKDPSRAGTSQISQWDSWVSMATWGWTLQGGQPKIDMSQFAGIASLVAKSPGIEYFWKQTRGHAAGDEEVDGSFQTINYPPTNAEYNNYYWPTLGVIVASYNYGPQAMVNEKMTPQQILGQPWAANDQPPQLKQWSDVVYLCWKKLTQDTQRPNLYWVVRRYISNAETVNMLAYVIRKKYPKVLPLGKAPAWDNRLKFTPDMEEFTTLLATPNVKSVVWLLVQHQSTFGKKAILSITAYDPDPMSPYEPDLMLEIGPLSLNY